MKTHEYPSFLGIRQNLLLSMYTRTVRCVSVDSMIVFLYQTTTLDIQIFVEINKTIRFAIDVIVFLVLRQNWRGTAVIRSHKKNAKIQFIDGQSTDSAGKLLFLLGQTSEFL